MDNLAAAQEPKVSRNLHLLDPSRDGTALPVWRTGGRVKGYAAIKHSRADHSRCHLRPLMRAVAAIGTFIMLLSATASRWLYQCATSILITVRVTCR